MRLALVADRLPRSPAHGAAAIATGPGCMQKYRPALPADWLVRRRLRTRGSFFSRHNNTGHAGAARRHWPGVPSLLPLAPPQNASRGPAASSGLAPPGRYAGLATHAVLPRLPWASRAGIGLPRAPGGRTLKGPPPPCPTLPLRLGSSPRRDHGLPGLRRRVPGHPRRDARLHHRLRHHHRCRATGVHHPFPAVFQPRSHFQEVPALEAHHQFPVLWAPGIQLLLQHDLPRYRYCRMLEEGSFRGRTADFIFMFLFGGFLMTLFGLFASLFFLGQAFTIMLVYVWSRRNPYIRMNFFGLLNFQAPFLPWVLMGFSLLLGNSIIIDLLGIVVGHIYYFLEDVFPNQPGGRQLLLTPGFLKLVFDPPEEDPNYNPLPEDPPAPAPDPNQPQAPQ